MSPFQIGLLGIGVLLVFMFFRVPVYLAFGLVGTLGSFYLSGRSAAMGVLGTVPYTWASAYVLLTIPLFVLMGQFAFQSGVSGELYAAAHKWLARLPGGLAQATMAACAAFGACTGASVAAAAAMGTICIPQMKRFGYDMRLAAGTVAVGGTLATMIPPSNSFVLYGVLTEESIGRLFLAGVLPGIMLAALFMASIFFRAKRNPALAPAGPSVSWRERLVSLKGLWGMLCLFGLVLGGLWGGIFTPTEAAAVGAFGAFLLCIVTGKLSMRQLSSSLGGTMKTTGMIFAILIGAMVFNHFLVVAGVAPKVSDWVGGLALPRYAIVAIILLIYLPLGMFMDSIAMIVLTIPIFYPVVTGLGFSGIWFGVLVTAMIEIGLVTPPVGLNCYVIAGIAKDDLSLTDVFRGAFPFVIIACIGIAILTAFPRISLWLPGMIK